MSEENLSSVAPIPLLSLDYRCSPHGLTLYWVLPNIHSHLSCIFVLSLRFPPLLLFWINHFEHSRSVPFTRSFFKTLFLIKRHFSDFDIISISLKISIVADTISLLHYFSDFYTIAISKRTNVISILYHWGLAGELPWQSSKALKDIKKTEIPNSESLSF